MEMFNTYLGKEVPQSYIDFVKNYDGKSFGYLTLNAGTRNAYSEEINIWTLENLLAYPKNDSSHNYDAGDKTQFYSWFNNSDLNYDLVYTNDDTKITKDEVKSALAIASIQDGFAFINMADGSVWLWHDTMLCVKQADSFEAFLKLLTEKPIVSDSDNDSCL